MTEWLLSGHNTQESTGVARPVTVTMTETGLDAQISWFLSQLAGDMSDFDQTLKPTEVVQGRLYLNINYYARNMGAVMPFDPTSVGVPAGLVNETAQVPKGRQLRLPWRLRRTYLWAANFYRHELPDLDHNLKALYWQLRKEPADPLPLIWPLFEPEFYAKSRDTDRAHIVVALTITALDGVLRQRAPQLLSLFTGQATATSLIGQRIWELRQTAEECGPAVSQMLRDGAVELDVYQALPEATPLVAAVRAFLLEYGHRGFRFEADFETERLADRPEHVMLAMAGQMSESEPPEQRARAARQTALEALVSSKTSARFAQVSRVLYRQPPGQPLLRLNLTRRIVIIWLIPGGRERQGEQVSRQISGTQAIVAKGVSGDGLLKGSSGCLAVSLCQSEFAQPEQGSRTVGRVRVDAYQRVPSSGGFRQLVQLIGL